MFPSDTPRAVIQNRRPRRSDRGAIIPIAALLITSLVVSVAFAIDLGRQRGDRRDLQAAADVIALDLVRLADGNTLDEILNQETTGDGVTIEYDHVRTRSAAANDVELAELTDVYGRWDRDTNTFTPSAAGTDVPNAVRVVIERSVDYIFQPGSSSTSRTAIAYQPEWANVSIGSRFAEANPCVFEDELNSDPCGIESPDVEELNTLLELMSGVADVDIDAVSYAGIVSANVTVGDLVVAAGVGSVDELLNLEMTPADVARLAVTALTNEGALVQAQFFSDRIVDISETREAQFFQPTPAVPDPPDLPIEDPLIPDEFWEFESPGSGSAAAGTVNMFDFWLASLELSNQKNTVTTCSGTTDNAEIEAAHDGVDDPTGGANAVVPPADLGPIAVISDQLCLDIIEARAVGMGPLGSEMLLRDHLRTSQLQLVHETLIRFGDPNTAVPLATATGCDLTEDNGVDNCSAIPDPPGDPCDAIAGNGVADCTALPGDPCDFIQDAAPADDGVPECPSPPPAECDNVAGNGIEDCVAALGVGCEIVEVPDNGTPACSVDPQNPDPCDAIAGNGVADCTAAEGDPCDIYNTTGVQDEDGVPECPISVPDPCDQIAGNGVGDCTALETDPCDAIPDNAVGGCPTVAPPEGCDDIAGNGIDDCVASVSGSIPSLPQPNLAGFAIPISGDLRLPMTIGVAAASADVTKIECEEETNDHWVTANIYRDPVTLEVGNGFDTPIGSITVTDPISGVEYGFDVFVDFDKTTEAADEVAFVPVGESHDAVGNDPFGDLSLTSASYRIERTFGLPDLPVGEAVGIPDQDVVDPDTGAVTTLSERAIRVIVAQTLQPVIDDLILIKDKQLNRAAGVPPLVENRLLSVLDQAGVGINSVEFTNRGIGIPVRDVDGNVVDFDVQCGLPTLVE